jgi:integrase
LLAFAVNAQASKQDSLRRRGLGASLRRAWKTGKLDYVPFVPAIHGIQPRERWLKKEEFASLLHSCHLPHLRLYVIIGILTGARPEAILSLTWDRIHLDRRLIYFNPVGRRQTSKHRPIVPINEALHRALGWCSTITRSEHPVIHYRGKPVRCIKNAFRTARAAAGLGDDVTPYVLRHTFATWALQRGVGKWDVAGLLGHSDTRMVEKHYGHHHPEFLRAAAEALSADFRTNCRPENNQRSEEPMLNPLIRTGGRGWNRTSDPYDVNVVLSR